MKVTVCFGNVRVIVPCGDGDLLVRELINKSITRYKKATGKPSHYWVTIHDLRSSNGGGILDPDDSICDVADDREQIVAHFEEQGGPPLHHNGGDGASASSVGTSSPDIFHTNSDIAMTTNELVSGSDVIVTSNDLISVTPLRVRRGSDPCLNLLTDDEPKPNYAESTGTFPKKSKRWSTFDPTPGNYITSTPKPKDLDLSDEGLPDNRASIVGSWPILDVKPSAFGRFSRDGMRQSLSNQPSMNRWLDAQERNLEKLHMPEGRHEPLGRPSSVGSKSQSPSPSKERTKHTLPPVPQSPADVNSSSMVNQSTHPEVTDSLFEIRLKREPGPLGIHVVPDISENDREQGLLVQRVEPDGRIFADGRLQADDRIVRINSASLHDISFQSAQDIFKRALLSDELVLSIVRRTPPPLPKVPPPILPKPNLKIKSTSDVLHSSADSSFYSRHGSHDQRDFNDNSTNPTSPSSSHLHTATMSDSSKNQNHLKPHEMHKDSLPELPSSPRRISASKRVPPTIPTRSPSTTLSNATDSGHLDTRNLDFLQTDIDNSINEAGDSVFFSNSSNARMRLKADNTWIKEDSLKANISEQSNCNYNASANSHSLSAKSPNVMQNFSQRTQSNFVNLPNTIRESQADASITSRYLSHDNSIHEISGGSRGMTSTMSNHPNSAASLEMTGGVRISASDHPVASDGSHKSSALSNKPMQRVFHNRKNTIHINLTKATSGIGFSVTTRDNPAGRNYPIYIKTVLPNGPAIQDGRLKAGDMLLEVNGTTMMGLSQTEAVNVLRAIKVGDPVNLIVSRSESHADKLPRELPEPLANDHIFQPNEWGDSDDPYGKLPNKNREIHTFNIPLNETGSAGLGISVKGITVQTEQGIRDEGIFIKNVISGGAVSKDGRLMVNDQLLQINDESLANLSNAESMDCLRLAMQKDGPIAGCINIKISRRIGPVSEGPHIFQENDMKFNDNINKLSKSEDGNVANDNGFVRPHTRAESIQSTASSEVSDVGALPSRPRHRETFESLKKRNESYSLAVRDSFDESQVPREENSPETRQTAASMRRNGADTNVPDTPLLSDKGDVSGTGHHPRLMSAPTVNEVTGGDLIIEHDDVIMRDENRPKRVRPHSSIGLMRTQSYSSSSQDNEDLGDKPPEPPEWLLEWERTRSICKEDSMDHIGFQRDGFTRRSLSEKRKGRHDARGTELYWRVKQQPKGNHMKARPKSFHVKQEPRRKWLSAFQPLMRSSSAESIFSSVGTSDVESSFSGKMKAELLKKSNSLESLDLPSSHEEPIPQPGDMSKSSARVRGFNESFRAAVDRSYTSESQPVKSMDTVDEESSGGSGGSLGLKGSHRSSFDDDSLKRRKKKGFLALFKFGKGRKPTEQPAMSPNNHASDYDSSNDSHRRRTLLEFNQNIAPINQQNKMYDPISQQKIPSHIPTEHISRIDQHKRGEFASAKQQKLTQWYQTEQLKLNQNFSKEQSTDLASNHRHHAPYRSASNPQTSSNYLPYPPQHIPAQQIQSASYLSTSSTTQKHGTVNQPMRSSQLNNSNQIINRPVQSSALSSIPQKQVQNTARNHALQMQQNTGVIKQYSAHTNTNVGNNLPELSRSERIQNLRLEHQRRHKERKGQYPEECDDLREFDLSLEDNKVQRYLEQQQQQRLTSRALPHLPPPTQRGTQPPDTRDPSLPDPRLMGMVPNPPPRQPSKPIIGRMTSNGTGYATGQSHYMNQSDIQNQLAHHEHYVNKFVDNASSMQRVPNQNSYNNHQHSAYPSNRNPGRLYAMHNRQFPTLTEPPSANRHYPEPAARTQYRTYTPTPHMFKSQNRAGNNDENSDDVFRTRSKSAIDDYDDPRFAYRQNVPSAFNRLNPNPAQV